MTFSIYNTNGQFGLDEKLDEKYKKTLEPFSLKVTKEDNGREYTTIEINNLQDLVDIVKKIDEEIIVCNELDVNGNVMLEIYDTWRE